MLGKDDELWLEELRSIDGRQTPAIERLRFFLLRGIARAFPDAGSAFAEDIAEDATVKVLANLDGFEGRSRLTTWAMSIAVRSAISELRRKRWSDVSLEALAEENNLEPRVAVDPTVSPEQRIDAERALDQLKKAMDSVLTDKQRLALQAEIAGMPMDEIARHMGTNLNALYKLTHDARKRLKRALESMGVSLDEVRHAFS